MYIIISRDSDKYVSRYRRKLCPFPRPSRTFSKKFSVFPNVRVPRFFPNIYSPEHRECRSVFGVTKNIEESIKAEGLIEVRESRLCVSIIFTVGAAFARHVYGSRDDSRNLPGRPILGRSGRLISASCATSRIILVCGRIFSFLRTFILF